MVEQSDTGERHSHIVLVAGLNNVVVSDRTAGLSNILNAGTLCSLDIVAEREERVGA